MILTQRGFTLTEVLITVVIIGILAAVVLPKFNKVLDAYKTEEAEQLLQSVRMEQEVALELKGAYLAPGKIAAFPGEGDTFESDYFFYTLGEDYMEAESINQSLSYVLEIDFGTGEICCDGADCDSLNKIYEMC